MAPLRLVIERAQQRGELPRSQNPSYLKSLSDLLP